jgi:hypothetical protein
MAPFKLSRNDGAEGQGRMKQPHGRKSCRIVVAFSRPVTPSPWQYEDLRAYFIEGVASA